MRIIRPFKNLPPINRQDLNNNFVDFAWITGYFKEDEVEKIRAIWDEQKAKEAEVNSEGKPVSKDDLRKSKIMFLKPEGNEWIYDKLSKACIQINGNRFQYDIRGFQTELQLACYDHNDFFDWHMDFGVGDVSNRKLSITVQLCDDTEYEGGDLEFMINKDIHKASRVKGTAIIFPSFAPHRVTQVTKGKRMSIVGWIAGPPYR
jgi:PKHD-type hydroxylase